MKTRILKREEWPRLEAAAQSPVFQHADQRDVAMVVVENAAGEIVGSMAVLSITHFENAWVSPAHRSKAGVLRALLRQAFAIAEVRGERWVMAGALDDDDAMLEYLRRLGGVCMPVRFHALPTGGGH